MAEESLHYLTEHLLPLCDVAVHNATGQWPENRAGGNTMTTVASEVTCPACVEWMHA